MTVFCQGCVCLGDHFFLLFFRSEPDNTFVAQIDLSILDLNIRCFNEAQRVNLGINAEIACDLLEPGALAKLPDARNVIFMAARKFGTTGARAQSAGLHGCGYGS